MVSIKLFCPARCLLKQPAALLSLPEKTGALSPKRGRAVYRRSPRRAVNQQPGRFFETATCKEKSLNIPARPACLYDLRASAVQSEGRRALYGGAILYYRHRLSVRSQEGEAYVEYNHFQTNYFGGL